MAKPLSSRFSVPTPAKIANALPTPANLPIESTNWSSYWMFLSASILIMLLFYLAVNGQLSTWLSLFSFALPTSVTSSKGTSPEVGGSAAASTTTPVSFAQSVLNAVGLGGGNVTSGTTTVPATSTPSTTSSTTPSGG